MSLILAIRRWIRGGPQPRISREDAKRIAVEECVRRGWAAEGVRIVSVSEISLERYSILVAPSPTTFYDRMEVDNWSGEVVEYELLMYGGPNKA